MNLIKRAGTRGAIGALAVLLLGGLGLAAPAQAAGELPDPARTANLHITKMETPAAGTRDNGVQKTPAPSNAGISGVQFTIKRVQSIDLTVQSGWNSAAALATSYKTPSAPTSPAAAEAKVTAAGYTLGTGAVGTTGAGGVLDFNGLPLGLYLVEETSTPAGVVPSAPFLVTLPMTNPVNLNSWMYDVYVYPKNSRNNITKTVSDATAVALNDNVVYTVKGDIPDDTGNNAPITGFLITDNLDSRLTWKSTTVALSNGVALTPGTDYTVVNPTDAGVGFGYLEVRFTAAGLTKLAANRAATVDVTITAVANAEGVIPNTARLYVGSGAVDAHDNPPPVNGVPQNPQNPATPPSTTFPPVITPPVTTKWGNVTVEKKSNTGTLLSGATFRVYTSLADAEAGNANYVTVNKGLTTPAPVSEWTTGANGQVTISGLRYSDWANNATVAAGQPGFIQYYLVETKAPAGYELQADPIPFTVTEQTTTGTPVVDLTVTDVPSNAGFELPFTGGSGTTWVYGLGLLMLLAAGVAVVANRRKTARN